MGDLNLPRDEREALNSIDVAELDRLIQEAVLEVRSGELHATRLASCGIYVSRHLSRFDSAVEACRKAKASKKVSETRNDVRSAGSDLLRAVREMKDRVEREAKDGQLFHVDDQIMPPRHFGKRMEVRVSFRWKRSVEDDWTLGVIAFRHEVVDRPSYLMPTATRKPSAARLAEEEQDRLYRIWEQLKGGALQSVHEHLSTRGGGEDIPESYQATVDGHLGGLNNYSTQFSRGQS